MSQQWDDPRMLDLLAQDLIWADWRRGYNRACIDSLANGDPPFSEEEAESMNLKVNINNLGQCRLLHKGRTTFSNGFFQQGQYMTTRTDWGPVYKRDTWSRIVEKEINKKLIDSIEYFEALRSKFALLVLHGIGPSVWRNSYDMIPEPIGVADLLMPTNTRLGFQNAPILTFRKSFTAMELESLVLAPKRDPGWQMPMVLNCLKWVDSEMKSGLDTSWRDYYKPEKWEEENKQQAGQYMADRVPTIDVIDIYAYVEATKHNKAGWVRRMILDSWSNWGPSNPEPKKKERKFKLDDKKANGFLYNSGPRVVADSWQHITSVQYADLSAVAPFMHNAVRSLGWLTYAQCHVDNRLECRMYDAGFEALMQYFRVKSEDDVNRAMKVELAHMGFIDPTIEMIPAQERWTPNAQFIELVKQNNKGNIEDSMDGYSQTPDGGNSRTEKTKFQYQAELQMMAAFVNSALNQAYMYQKFEDQEIFRRVMRPNSKDPLVRSIRERCLRQNVPEKLMASPEAWDVQHERMMGQGNQTLELMVAKELLELAPTMEGDPQRVVRRNFVTTLTHNPQLAIELYPDAKNKTTPAATQAANDCATMLSLIPVEPEEGTNHLEYVTAELKILGARVKVGKNSPQHMVEPKELMGLKAIADNAHKHIQFLAQDPSIKPVVKKLNDELAKDISEINAFEQRLQKAQQAAKEKQQQGNGAGGEAMAKVAPAIIAAKAKAGIKRAEAAQKLQHKEVAFKQDLHHKAARTKAEIAKADLTTAAEVRRKGMASLDEGEDES